MLKAWNSRANAVGRIGSFKFLLMCFNGTVSPDSEIYEDGSWPSNANPIIQLSECKFIDDSGSVVGLNSKQDKFSLTGIKGECRTVSFSSSEKVDKLFDGSLLTKWCTSSGSQYGFVFNQNDYCWYLLRESSDKFDFKNLKRCEFYTAGDSPLSRSPLRIRIFSSDDKESWNLIGDSGDIPESELINELYSLYRSVDLKLIEKRAELPYELPNNYWY